MENTNTEIIIKEKKKTSEAMKEAQKRYYNKKKENPEFQAVRREYSKKHYNNNKEKVIDRVRSYQRRVTELEQLERLYELQQEGLIHLVGKEYEKINNKLLDKVAHIHLSS